MKSRIFSIIFFIFLFYQNSTSQTLSSGWSWIHPRPQGQYINWLKMIDANTWYIGADYGQFIKTTNAGANWVTITGGYQSTLYPGAGIYTNILTGFFFNANTGFLGYQSCRGIVKTTNGGNTLDTVQILTSGSGSIFGIHFINAQTGYFSGTSTFKAYRTLDGGATWNQVPNLPSATFYSVYAPDTNNIIVASTSGNTYYTTNGGTSWTTSNIGTTNTLYNMKFINSTTGYVCGSTGCFRYTTNFGANWSGTSAPTSGTMYGITVSGGEVYICGTSNPDAVYKTTDNGSSWITLPSLASGQLALLYPEGIDKVGSTIIIAGSYGQINKSTDNGATWQTVNYSKSLANMVDIYGQSGTGRVVAIGSDIGYPDQVIYSSNGGLNWNASSYSGLNVLSSLCMVNSTTGYLSGRFGTLARTTDGGATWDTTISNNPTLAPYFLNGVEFINVNTGWIAGGTPGIGGVTKIWKTTDAGINWTEQVSAYSGPVGVKIDMVDANTGYMTHAAGLQKTTNGGDNWTLLPIPAPFSTSYTPIKVVDANNVFTGSSNSQVYSTSNGGTTWDSLNFPVKAGTIFCTDWYDANNGVALAVIGVIGKTTNHGASWQITNIGGYTVMNVKMVHPDTMYAVSGNTAGAQVFKYIKSLTGGFFWESQVPSVYKLEQNYPNPFNPSTKIKFAIPNDGIVSLKVFDLTGREVSTLVNSINLRAGTMSYDFDGSELSSGVYFYSLIVDNNLIATKKMVLVK